MPTRNALGAIRLTYTKKRVGPYRVQLQVWSHSYDHPDPNSRSSLITGVSLTQLPGPAGSYTISGLKITDRYGIDETKLWAFDISPTDTGWLGYTEVDTGRPCQPGFPNVIWGAYTGIYDERCAADFACDARRFQTTVGTWPQISVFNYLLGPVTFSFGIDLPSPPTAVRLKVGVVGGNGGNPAVRIGPLVSEEFVIQFP